MIACQIWWASWAWNWTSSPGPTVWKLLVQVLTYKKDIVKRSILLKCLVFLVFSRFDKFVVSVRPFESDSDINSVGQNTEGQFPLFFMYHTTSSQKNCRSKLGYLHMDISNTRLNSFPCLQIQEGKVWSHKNCYYCKKVWFISPFFSAIFCKQNIVNLIFFCYLLMRL